MSLLATSWTIVVPEKLACNVYIGCMPLRVPALAPKALPSVLTHLGVQHFYTLVQQQSDETCMYYDFLPADPENPLVIAAVLSGQRVKGLVQHLTGKKDVISRLDVLRSRNGLDTGQASTIINDED